MHYSRHVATAFVHGMRDMFSNKRIEKSYNAVFWGMIPKIKTTRRTTELQ